MPDTNLPPEEIQRLLMQVVEHFDDEDREVRERQIRKCRRLKFMWDNIFETWWSEVAHDWRIYDQTDDDSDQAAYDKPMNIFRAYIESIIAALSITTPVAKCFPDDAESSIDIVTARTGDKIGQLIGRHNNTPLLWLHALFIFYTEGTVFGYGYPRTDESYGTYDVQKTEEESLLKNTILCPICGSQTFTDASAVTDVFMPELQQPDVCESCGNMTMMEPGAPQPFITTKIVGESKEPKSRVCLEAHGGLYCKIANYAKKQSDTPYLIYAYETHYANAVEEYEHLREKDWVEKIKGGQGPEDPYAQWGRLNTLYKGEYPQYVVTMRKTWLRPSAFNILPAEEAKKLRKKYPRGAKVCMVNDEFASAESQNLDDYWSISVNPMEDFLTHDAQGTNLVAGQEITNDLISLVLQTVEHGINQTFADPGVLDFNAYRQTETVPGGVYEATPKSGKSLAEGFFEMKTATLSAEIMPFFEMIQSLNQLLSGALPSLFGGEIGGSNTASEYSMSRAQALQRCQNVWKIFTSWWKEIQGKVIPMFINNMKTDEKDVQKTPDGSFINVMIRKSELEGKIGKIELEAAENLPNTASQVKDTIMKIIESQNEFLMSVISSPENIPKLRDAIGLVDFNIPGEDQRNEQNDEIRELLASEPIQDPALVLPQAAPGMNEDPEADPMMQEQEQDPMMQEQQMIPPDPATLIPSVPIDPVYNDHAIHFETVKKWATSDWGRQTKIDNPSGYENVLLHGRMHFQFMNEQLALQQENQANAEKPPGEQNENQINEESDVNSSV